MPLSSLLIRAQNTPQKRIIAQYIIILFAAYLLATILSPTLWTSHTNIFHTAFELLCIFVALSSFFTAWYTYDSSSTANRIMGFGFLSVAIFDIFHTMHFSAINLFPPVYYDLHTRYWILGRFTEAAVLLVCSCKTLNIKVNKWAGLTLSAVLTLGLCTLVLYFPGIMPVLLTGQGPTPIKIALEYVIIAMFLSSLCNLKYKADGRDILTYRYIYLALLIAIPAELCFTLFKTLTSFYMALGHILKVIYYYYLFRGIFVSAVTYPHEKLEEAGRYMAEILNGLPIGLATFDRNLKLSFANRKALEISGCKEEEWRSLTAKQLTVKLYGEEATEELVIKQLAKTSKPIVNKIKTIKNKYANIKVSIDAQRLDNGDSLILLTEAKKEQELENLKLQTRTILNSLSNLVILVDADDRVIMCNRAFEAAAEMDRWDLLGMKMKDLQELLKFKVKEAPAKVMPADCLKEVKEASFTTAYGRRRELVLQYAPISNVDGEIIGGIFVASDVTELKQEQQKLQQWEKMALLGEMAAGIVHEIKNPLTTIKGFSSIIASKSDDEVIKSYAHTIESTANDVNRVVSDFLAFARPRAPILVEISLNDLVKSMRLMLESHLLTKRVDFGFDLSAEEKMVMADKDQIKQVLLNVVKNAIEAMSETKNPRLKISTGLNEIKDEMMITISDNGRGMTSEDRLKAGTPFYTTKDNGPGLGLSICYQIVNRHGGRIGIKSEPFGGTSLTISLPCRVAGESCPPLPQSVLAEAPWEATL